MIATLSAAAAPSGVLYFDFAQLIAQAGPVCLRSERHTRRTPGPSRHVSAQAANKPRRKRGFSCPLEEADPS
jgi:hypothetical protein